MHWYTHRKICADDMRMMRPRGHNVVSCVSAAWESRGSHADVSGVKSRVWAGVVKSVMGGGCDEW